jgi:nucleoside-diphosphate-sugar epimerase
VKIVITGANGFVGRHLVQDLASKGFDLAAGVRQGSSVPTEWQALAGVSPVRLEGKAPFDKLLDGANTVIHLAGLAAAPRAGDAEAALHEANVVLTAELVEAANRAGVKRFIHLSSIRAVVGTTSAAVIDDRVLPAPVDAYGRSKLQSERLVADFAGPDRLAVTLRPPLVIGPGAKGNWRRLQQIAASNAWLPFAGITNRRSYLSVDTLCEAINHLCARNWPTEFSGAYALANPEALSLPAVVSALRQGMGRPARLFTLPGLGAMQRVPALGGPARSLFGSLEVDPSRFLERFAFRPSRPIREAIAASGSSFLSARP